MSKEAAPPLRLCGYDLECEDLKSLKTQREYVAAQKSFDKAEYYHVLGILNRLLDVDKDPRHYALLGATLVKLRMKTEAAQAFQLAGEQESRHRLKYLREAMRLHSGLAVMTPEAMDHEVYRKLEQEMEKLSDILGQTYFS